MPKYNDEILLDFLQGRLDISMQNAIQNDLDEDPELQKELDFQRAILGYIQINGEESLKKHLIKILPSKKVKMLPQPRRKYWLWVVSAAASMALLFLGSQFLFETQQTASSIYANHYSAYELNFGSRGSSLEDSVQRVGSLYQRKEYKKAEPIFIELLETQENSKYRLALGICQIETQKYADAVHTLQVIINTQDSVYKTHAHWYKGMAHLKLNQLELAHKEFQVLSEEPEYVNYDEAKSILNQKLFQKK